MNMSFFKWLRSYHLALLMLGLLFFLPFSLLWRIGPQPGFFLEALSLGLLLLMVLATAASGILPRKIPTAAWCLLLLAVFFPLQSLLIKPLYPGYAWLMFCLFTALAFAAWTLAGLREQVGLDNLLATIATALLMAVLWQSFVCWMQFFDLTGHFYQTMMHAPSAYYVFGQLGQRNHLGHLMMWGLLSGCYLFAEGRLNARLSLFSLAIVILTLGIIGSRTILLYLAFLLPVCAYYYFRRPLQRKMADITFIALAAVLLAQWLLPHLLAMFLHIGLMNGLERAADGGGETAVRLYEWHKAWLAFLNHPWLGTGWMGYAYESVDKSRLFAYPDIPHPNVLFTHCHNLILQLLAETGLIGTVLICGTCLWLIRHLFRLPAHNGMLLLGGALSVSVIHSLLEYPLWYVYFLLPFFVLLLLVAIPATAPKPAASRTQWIVAVTICIALGSTLYQCFQYSRLMRLDTRTTKALCADHAYRLHRFAAQNMFLAYYADAASTQCLGSIFAVEENTRLPWLHGTIARTAHFRPFPTQAVQWGVEEAYNSNSEAAREWLRTVWQYYPKDLPQGRQESKQNKALAPVDEAAEDVRKIIQAAPN